MGSVTTNSLHPSKPRENLGHDTKLQNKRGKATAVRGPPSPPLALTHTRVLDKLSATAVADAMDVSNGRWGDANAVVKHTERMNRIAMGGVRGREAEADGGSSRHSNHHKHADKGAHKRTAILGTTLFRVDEDDNHHGHGRAARSPTGHHTTSLSMTVKPHTMSLSTRKATTGILEEDTHDPGFFMRNLSIMDLEVTRDLHGKVTDAEHVVRAQAAVWSAVYYHMIRHKTYQPNKAALAVVGCGRMGRLIVGTLLWLGWPTDSILVCTRDVAKVHDLQRLGITCTSDHAMLHKIRLIFLCVAPIHLRCLTEQLVGEDDKRFITRRCMVVSTLAGVTVEKVKTVLQHDVVMRALVDMRRLPVGNRWPSGGMYSKQGMDASLWRQQVHEACVHFIERRGAVEGSMDAWALFASRHHVPNEHVATRDVLFGQAHDPAASFHQSTLSNSISFTLSDDDDFSPRRAMPSPQPFVHGVAETGLLPPASPTQNSGVTGGKSPGRQSLKQPHPHTPKQQQQQQQQIMMLRMGSGGASPRVAAGGSTTPPPPTLRDDASHSSDGEESTSMVSNPTTGPTVEQVSGSSATTPPPWSTRASMGSTRASKSTRSSITKTYSESSRFEALDRRINTDVLPILQKVLRGWLRAEEEDRRRAAETDEALSPAALTSRAALAETKAAATIAALHQMPEEGEEDDESDGDHVNGPMKPEDVEAERLAQIAAVLGGESVSGAYAVRGADEVYVGERSVQAAPSLTDDSSVWCMPSLDEPHTV